MFPANPNHNDQHIDDGSYYKYDATLKSWVPISSNISTFEAATPVTSGLMSAEDYSKLQQLVIPFPSSTLTATECPTPFRNGVITLAAGDELITVNGNIAAKNIDEFGDRVSRDYPFKVHKHTYAYDFKVNFPQFLAELEERGQVDLTGTTGAPGETGDKGPRGVDLVLSGPAGNPGPPGNAPPCEFQVSQEPIAVQLKPGPSRAVTGAKIVVNGMYEDLYEIHFRQQTVGRDNSVTAQVRLRGGQSNWVLALEDASQLPQAIYYIDMEPIMSAAHTKFLEEIGVLKKGYEDIVKYWTQKMSDLFDEQKAALCCALEFCISSTKNISSRQHMETVAATATAGKAKIRIHGTDSTEGSYISSTKILTKIDAPDHTKAGGPDVCDNGQVFPGPVTPVNFAGSQDAGPTTNVVIDPLLHNSSLSALVMDLPAGDYIATIKSTTAAIDGYHHADVKVRSTGIDSFQTAQFLNKGRYKSGIEAKSAYEGLNVPFSHIGGPVEFWLPVVGTTIVSGQIEIEITKSVPTHDQITLEPAAAQFCSMTGKHLLWYQSEWEAGNCCGVVVTLNGQDYIIVKKTLGDDQACGGGESLDTPCIALFNSDISPAIAWPSFDGETFAPIPAHDVRFYQDPDLTASVLAKIADHTVSSPKGNPNGVRHLTHQLSNILFPSHETEIGTIL